MLMNTPPPAAKRPRLTSGTPKEAADDATTTSQPRSSSKPPATAVAFAAPTMGTAISPLVKRTKPRMASGLPLMPPEPPSAKPRRSMPAQKARSPVPVSTTARTSGSFSASSMARPMADSSSGFNALRASGRLSRSTCTAPRRSLTRTGSAGASAAVSVIRRQPFCLADPRWPQPRWPSPLSMASAVGPAPPRAAIIEWPGVASRARKRVQYTELADGRPRRAQPWQSPRPGATSSGPVILTDVRRPGGHHHPEPPRPEERARTARSSARSTARCSRWPTTPT